MSSLTPSLAPAVPVTDGTGVTLAFNSGTGGMDGTTATTGAPAVTASPNTATLPASLRLPLGFQTLTLETLGIRMPGSPGDTAALLAQVAQQLDVLMDQAGQARSQQIANALRSLLGNVSGLSAGIALHREEYRRLETLHDGKVSQVSGDVAQREALEADRAGKINQRTTLTLTVTSLNGQITSLDNQIAALAALGGDTTALEATRAGLIAQRTQAQGQISTLSGQITQLASAIAMLTAQIDEEDGKITSLRAQMAAEKAIYEGLETQQAIALNVFSQYALGIAGREDLAALERVNWNEDIERLFDNLAETLKQLQTATSSQSNTVQALSDAARQADLAAEAFRAQLASSVVQTAVAQTAAGSGATPATGAATQATTSTPSSAAASPSPALTAAPAGAFAPAATAFARAADSADPLAASGAADLARARALAAGALALVSGVAHIVTTLGGLDPMLEGVDQGTYDGPRPHLAI